MVILLFSGLALAQLLYLKSVETFYEERAKEGAVGLRI
jgi:hypothetical protein